jgi:hypothetical protein
VPFATANLAILETAPLAAVLGACRRRLTNEARRGDQPPPVRAGRDAPFAGLLIDRVPGDRERRQGWRVRTGAGRRLTVTAA